MNYPEFYYCEKCDRDHKKGSMIYKDHFPEDLKLEEAKEALDEENEKVKADNVVSMEERSASDVEVEKPGDYLRILNAVLSVDGREVLEAEGRPYCKVRMKYKHVTVHSGSYDRVFQMGHRPFVLEGGEVGYLSLDEYKQVLHDTNMFELLEEHQI